MSLKLFFNNEIHKSTKPPAAYETLLDQVKLIFRDQLPELFNLQYEDSEGDKIVLTSDEEYKELLQATGKNCVKIYVVAKLPPPSGHFSESLSIISQSESQENFNFMTVNSPQKEINSAGTEILSPDQKLANISFEPIDSKSQTPVVTPSLPPKEEEKGIPDTKAETFEPKLSQLCERLQGIFNGRAADVLGDCVVERLALNSQLLSGIELPRKRRHCRKEKESMGTTDTKCSEEEIPKRKMKACDPVQKAKRMYKQARQTQSIMETIQSNIPVISQLLQNYQANPVQFQKPEESAKKS